MNILILFLKYFYKKIMSKLTEKQQSKVKEVMNEYAHKKLHSGQGQKIVKNQKQAIAIALSEARRRKK